MLGLWCLAALVGLSSTYTGKNFWPLRRHVHVVLRWTWRRSADGLIFRCPTCKTTKSLRDGSFFNRNKLRLQKWFILLYWWVHQYPVSDAAEEAKVGRNTAIDVYQWLREVCTTRLIGTTIKLGGAGKVVNLFFGINQSTIGVMQHLTKYGCLGWWTHRWLHPWAIWRLFTIQQPPHCCR